ncbi:MAG: peroxidase, partial [Bacteroidales bacterium]|nr:peroxidase [Bacteroidales bacterium]
CIQHITYDEFLPLLLGQDALPDYEGYESDIDPSISQLFSTAAFRVGHTLLSPQFSLLDEDGNRTGEGEIALRDAFFQSADQLNNDFMDSLLRGLATDKAQDVDNMVIDDVRQFLVGEGFGTLGFDLPALNIQRGRDHGLPLYNDAREAMGLERQHSFADITDDPDVQAKLASVYHSVDQIDPWVGGLAEDPKDGALVGEFFYEVILDQFVRSRDGDRFFTKAVSTMRP